MTGLVLCGGGLYGAVHVGVLEGLQELGIVPDFVVGTSAGALVAGLWAVGLNPAQLRAVASALTAQDLPVDWRGFSRAILRQRRLPDRIISDDPLARKLEGLAGHLTVRRTPRPCWITATSLTRREVVVFGAPLPADAHDTTGRPLISWPRDVPLLTALRASIAVPGLFRPVVLDNELLVDGGVLDDYPVDVALAAGATRVIGVRLTERRGGRMPDGGDPPHVLAAAAESLSLMLEDAQRLRSLLRADRIDRPAVELAVSVGGVGLTDFDRIPALIDRGRDAVRAEENALLALVGRDPWPKAGT